MCGFGYNEKCAICLVLVGHGKGLVDAVSGFGVKGPLGKVLVTKALCYENVEDILTLFSGSFSHKSKIMHYLGSSILSFISNGTIQVK